MGENIKIYLFKIIVLLKAWCVAGEGENDKEL